MQKKLCRDNHICALRVSHRHYTSIYLIKNVVLKKNQIFEIFVPLWFSRPFCVKISPETGRKLVKTQSWVLLTPFLAWFCPGNRTKWLEKPWKNSKFRKSIFFSALHFLSSICLYNADVRLEAHTYDYLDTFFFILIFGSSHFESLYIEISIGSGIKIRPKTEIFEISQFWNQDISKTTEPILKISDVFERWDPVLVRKPS